MPNRRKRSIGDIARGLRRPVFFPEIGLEADVVRGLRSMLVAAMLWQVCTSITTGSALTGYIKALGASDMFYSVMAAIPNFTVIVQLFAAVVLEKSGKRRGMLIGTGLVAKFLWLPFGLVPFFVPMEAETLRLWIAFLLFIASACNNGFMLVSFNSFITDYVPLRIRGNYLGTRAKLSMIAGGAAGLLLAFILDSLPGYPGYAVVFSLAAICGMGDLLLLSRIKMPEIQHESGRVHMIKMFREVFANKPFMRTVRIFALWYFFVGIGSPFYNLFLLRDMKMSFMQLTLMATLTNNLAWALTVGKWGQYIDTFGARAVLRILMVLSGIGPLIYGQLHIGILWIVVPLEMLVGLSWGGFEIGAQVTYFRQSPTKNRSMYIAMYAIMTLLVGQAFGSFVGGMLVETMGARLEALQWAPLGFAYARYQYIFTFVGLGRLLVAIFLVPRLHESEEHSEQRPKHVISAMHRSVRQFVYAIRLQSLRRQARRQQAQSTKKKPKENE